MHHHLKNGTLKKYSTVSSCSKQIEYDIKHGVTAEEVAELMNKIRNDAAYSEIRQNQDAIQRLDELEGQLNSPKKSSWEKIYFPVLF
jgi:cell division septum initiation protein DivIVA